MSTGTFTPAGQVTPPVGVVPGGNIDSNLLAVIKAKIRPEAIAWIRQYLQDIPEYNELQFDKKELTDEEIAMSILAGIDYADAIPPPVAIYSPGSGMPVFLFTALCSLDAYSMIANRHLRQELAAADSGVAVDRTKSDKWIALRDRERQYAHQLVKDYKKSRNSRARRLLPSPYLFDPFF